MNPEPADRPLPPRVQLRHLFLSRGHNFFGHHGQVTFFASEVFADVCRQVGVAGKSPGLTRHNIITDGVPRVDA